MCLQKNIIRFLQNIRGQLIQDVSLGNCNQIYNEASLQYELAKFLEEQNYKVRLEFNIKKYINNKNINFTKRDIDIVALKGEKKYAIELKFPRNKRYPEEMFNFIKDIKFMEEVKKEGFNNTYCLTIVDDNGFYEYRNNLETSIYNSFRRNNLEIRIHKNTYYKPTGNKKQSITLSSCYKSKWRKLTGEYKYYLITI